ncbi:EamA family transporter RarD [Pelosinus baikalensis]|uniref:EamA family transporter RarD n=1 Tax=Pelosinus baikalensis TaxID=2892015 RepID=A0ABS8HV47_9FIRM|nr:EamA family transporter RarD [Pelosinus baikalensis]MCC5465789.1 EamA family transporter RarD [Pelosinus baikalensis]
MEQNENLKRGLTSAIGAYFLWGILPIYWKLVSNVSAQEVIAHRVFWSLLFMLAVVILMNRKKQLYEEITQLLAAPTQLLALMIGTIFITLNWFIFIWAVNNNRVIETSLGYYISPLVSILLGILFFRERLSLGQSIAVILAASGVLYMTMHFGSVPWAAICLALSFGLYGLCKKKAVLSPITSITLETLIVAPFAFLYLLYLGYNGSGSFDGLSLTSLFLVGGGIVTPIPLLLFANSANRLSLTMLGFIQYLAPTISLLLGIFLYHEAFTIVHAVSFGLIWAALLVFSLAGTKFFLRSEILLQRFNMLFKE